MDGGLLNEPMPEQPAPTMPSNPSNVRVQRLRLKLVSLFVVLAAFAQLAILWGTDWTLGVTGEWEWPRVEFTGEYVGSLLLVMLVSAAYTGIVIMTGRWVRNERRLPLAITILSTAGAAWLFLTLWSLPGVAGLGRAPFILYYPGPSGYYTQASEIDSVSKYLAGYQEKISDETVSENHLHLGTHPPGLTLMNKVLIDLNDALPALNQIAQATQPAAVQRTFSEIQMNELRHGREVPESHFAAIWWMTVLTLVLGCATVCPLFLLIKRTVSPIAAWWAVAFWPMVPALAIFFPKSDMLYPFFAVLMQWLWLKSLDRESWVHGIFTGIVAFFALNLTLAFAPVGLMMALQAAFRIWNRSRSKPSTELDGNSASQSGSGIGLIFKPIIASGLTLLALIGLVWFFSGMNLFGVWAQNLLNHASFYDHYTRSYVPWLLVNPIELAMSVGGPLAVCAIAGGLIALFNKREHGDLLIALSIWMLLWVSGKNLGEAARLWILLMPIALWASSLTIQRLLEKSHSSSKSLIVLWVLHISTAVFTIIRVTGFHFPG